MLREIVSLTASQILIAAGVFPEPAPPVPGPLQSVFMDRNQFLALGADPALAPHQAHGPEQIALDHEAAKAPDPLLWVDPVQHQVVLNGRPELGRH